MKKMILAMVFVLAFVFNAFAGAGAYISKISADSKGLTLDSKGQVYIKSAGAITLAPATSLAINSTTSQKIDATTTLELEADGLMTIDANNDLFIDAVRSVTITSSTFPVYYGILSGAAATAANTACKIVVGYTAAKVDGIGVTLTADSIFTNANSYWVFLTEYKAETADQPTLGCKVAKVSGSYFIVSGDASSTYQYMAIGY